MNSIRPLSTSQMGKEHEEYIVEVLAWANARRSRSSGASFHDPIDVTSDVLVTECEATEKKSYSLKLSFWEEIVQKQHSGKLPSLAIRFLERDKQKTTDLIVMEAETLSEILEELEAHRNLALERE